MKGKGLSIALVTLLFIFPWLAVTLIANLSIIPTIAPPSNPTPPVNTGGGPVVVVPSLVQGPSLVELAVLGGALSLAGGFIIWRSWKRRRKSEDYWYVENQKGNPLVPILLLGLVAVAFYGLSTLLRYGTIIPGGQGQGVIFPNLLPYLAAGAIIASAAVGAALFLSLGGFPNASSTKPSSAEPSSGRAEEERIAEVLKDTARALGHGSDYRGTILDCYRAICQILDRDEENESAKLTAREFEALVASRVKVDSRYLHEATMLFEKARYSVDPVYDEDAKRAETCLRRLSEEVHPSRPYSPSIGAR
jgi:hypothetical protein